MMFQGSSNLFTNLSNFYQRLSAERNASEHGRQTSPIIFIVTWFSIVKKIQAPVKKKKGGGGEASYKTKDKGSPFIQ